MKFSVPTTIIEQKLVTVAYINEKVEVESSPQSFSDFNSWVRSRFGLKSTDKISFRNFAGAEIIPGANYFCKADYIEIVIENREQLVKDSSPKENVGNALGLLAQPARTHSDVPSDFFCFYGAPCLVILVAMTLAPQSSIFIAFVLRKVFETNRSRNIAVDCFVSFLSWSSTYLFVRRLLNPETTPVVFKKFSADAFYGGLAAASTAFIKPLLTAALQTST